MGSFHHMIICVTDLPRSRAAYAWLMPEVGFPTCQEFPPAVGWFAEVARFWIRPQDPKFAGDPPFSKDRVGLCEICFQAPSRAAVDALARALPEHGFRILDAPKEYPYAAGYYAVFFADPDGIKLEFAFIGDAA